MNRISEMSNRAFCALIAILGSILIALCVLYVACDRGWITVEEEEVELFGLRLGESFSPVSNRVDERYKDVSEMVYSPYGCQRYKLSLRQPFDIFETCVITVEKASGKIIQIEASYPLLGCETIWGRHVSELFAESKVNNLSVTALGRSFTRVVPLIKNYLEKKYLRQVNPIGRFRHFHEMQFVYPVNDPDYFMSHCDKKAYALFLETYGDSDNDTRTAALCFDSMSCHPRMDCDCIEMSDHRSGFVMFDLQFNCEREILCFGGGDALYPEVGVAARNKKFISILCGEMFRN